MDIVRLLGFILIIVATIIITVKIPRLDKQISQINDEIASFKDSRIITFLSILSYGEQFTRRRIELFEANNVLLLTKDIKTVEEIRKRALDQTISLAEQWAYLYGGDNANSLEEEVKNNIESIINNSDLDLSAKLEQVEKIWKDSQRAASNRIANAHKEWHTKEDEVNKLKNNRDWWNGLFVWLQILGLIFLSGTEVIDKLFKR